MHQTKTLVPPALIKHLEKIADGTMPDPSISPAEAKRYLQRVAPVPFLQTQERQEFNMPSPSNQPDLPMDLPKAKGPSDAQRYATRDDEIERAVQDVERRHAKPRRMAR